MTTLLYSRTSWKKQTKCLEKLDFQNNGQMKSTPAHNGLAKVMVQWLHQRFCFISGSVLADGFQLRNRHLRQAAQRYPEFK